MRRRRRSSSRNPAPKDEGQGEEEGDAAPKQGWSLPTPTEQDLVGVASVNTYLWLRSTKDYHGKKASWEMKAKELGISLKHLQNWWKKNVKDGILSCPRGPVPGNQDVDGEGQVGVEDYRLLQKFLPTDVPDSLVKPAP
ncbi:hypothetical protein GWK47_030765 [Chionoecetes opilio]|uniref:Uncharacterized protein n=1 Tax=Chionoecetes opilio TaxID=41210 RepID=A0A8J4YKP8_CHIOP|nr:hypothetical protein GWK47_030765 [Chionoecetes opilio]